MLHLKGNPAPQEPAPGRPFSARWRTPTNRCHEFHELHEPVRAIRGCLSFCMGAFDSPKWAPGAIFCLPAPPDLPHAGAGHRDHDNHSCSNHLHLLPERAGAESRPRIAWRRQVQNLQEERKSRGRDWPSRRARTISTGIRFIRRIASWNSRLVIRPAPTVSACRARNCNPPIM